MIKLASILLFAGLLSSTAWALEITRGDWRQGAVIRGKVEPGSKLYHDGRQLRLSEQGDFVLGLGRDAPERISLKVIDPEGESHEHQFEVARRDYKIQRVEGVPQSTVTPNAEQIARARKEATLVRQAREKDLVRTDFTTEFQWPLVGPITGVYGSQRFYNGEPRRPHYGVDIALPRGTEVVAPAPGLVTLVHENMFFSGGTLIIDHGHGLSSTFMHLSKILVEEGDEVAQGEPIARVGATGRVTGPHLDWRMNWFDRRVDPASLVGPMPQGLSSKGISSK